MDPEENQHLKDWIRQQKKETKELRDMGSVV